MALAIARVLGGVKMLGATPKTALNWQNAILTGLPVQSAEYLKNKIALSDKHFAELIGVKEKTLSRSASGRARLHPVVSDRLYRLARIVALAIEVLEEEESAVSWLKRAQAGLGGSRPISLLATDAGRVEVENLLLRIERGVRA